MNLIRRLTVSLAERGTIFARRGLEAAQKNESFRTKRKFSSSLKGYLISSMFLSLAANITILSGRQVRYPTVHWIVITLVVLAVNGLLYWHSSWSRRRH